MAAVHEAARLPTFGEPGQSDGLGSPIAAPGPLVGQAAVAQPRVEPAVSDVARCGMGPQPESVRRARHFAAEALRRWSLDRLGESVELLVSELVTNALRHGLTEDVGKHTDVAESSRHADVSSGHADAYRPVELILARESPHLMCIVTDPGDDVPMLGDPADLAENGRGLHVVASCCRRWGWARFAAGGKAVWALVHYEPPG